MWSIQKKAAKLGFVHIVFFYRLLFLHDLVWHAADSFSVKFHILEVNLQSLHNLQLNLALHHDTPSFWIHISFINSLYVLPLLWILHSTTGHPSLLSCWLWNVCYLVCLVSRMCSFNTSVANQHLHYVPIRASGMLCGLKQFFIFHISFFSLLHNGIYLT